jgi:hypothetical protein
MDPDFGCFSLQQTSAFLVKIVTLHIVALIPDMLQQQDYKDGCNGWKGH